ncbi:MAG TPA: MATE family efflux transporter [Afifellaceae bacterium]|nr:MATE family efflux transporter [Afifellaceae bacterium]
MTARILSTTPAAAPAATPRFGIDRGAARALLALAAPITGAALVNMGMSITDTVMMGWIGPGALAAGAVISDIQSIVFYFMSGILSIVSPLVARALGAGRPEEAARAMQHGILATFVVALPAFLAIWHSAELIQLFGVGEDVVSMGRDYAHAIAIAAVLMLFVAVWRYLFEAIGRPRVYLAAVFAALPLNALANQVLMFGWGPVPAFGLAGAGIASALVAFLLLVILLLYGALGAAARRLDLFAGLRRIDTGLLLEIFRLGVPIGFFTIGEVGIFLMATVVVSLYGVDALAAHAITLRAAGVIYAIPLGLSQATTVRVSHALGAAEADLIRCAIGSARGVGAVAGFAICAFLVAGSDIAAGRLGEALSGDIAHVLAGMFVVLGILNLAQGFAAPANAILRAYKDTRTPMFLCLAGYWLIGMPIALLAAFGFGQDAYGIWLGLASGVFANAVLINLRLRRVERRPHA